MRTYKPPMRLSEIQVTYKPKQAHRPQILQSSDAYYVLTHCYDWDTIAFKEDFYLLCLSRSNRVLGYHHVSKGSVKGTVVDVSQVIAVAIKANASSILVSHSHPSGNLNASQADLELTKKLKKACELFDITLLDHIIVTPENGYMSFADNGML